VTLCGTSAETVLGSQKLGDMRVNLLNVPLTQQDWDRWAFSHKESHRAIIEAIVQNGGTRLTEYVLDPISENDFKGFLDRNQQMHLDATSLLGVLSINLNEVDFKDPAQRQAWIFNHYQNHYDLETKLGIAS
jgi:hypothetical protein